MKFSESLKKNIEFKNVYNNGKSLADKNIVMYVLKNNLNKNRIGISVSKKVGNSVVRHHMTRIFREIYRINEENFEVGFDIVIICRNKALYTKFKNLVESYINLAKLHGIYKQ
ncbi:ribonuclease P protein component [Acetitomaculum ruminis DSM 5522]|uniref:Ribonuclease P protein component n=1 Tax=Acetitomaculum ruminis DSM 5522 TaxID=1120918 RepID=A0A1I0ZE73_9FIRM|nr:ribonuclease P protein component [Acetitomaculum ruminis]SFB23697.1 ribonuclease P protein component [Acetitomaculum ruminis DSM 5522]